MTRAALTDGSPNSSKKDYLVLLVFCFFEFLDE